MSKRDSDILLTCSSGILSVAKANLWAVLGPIEGSSLNESIKSFKASGINGDLSNGTML